MLKVFAKGLLVAALVLSLGAHWLVLQSVAWTGMLVTYTQQAGFFRAVEMTFDGDHPCALCKTIQKGKTEERQEQQNNVQPVTELKLNLPPAQFIVVHPPFPRVVSIPAKLTSLSELTPELPPPRLAWEGALSTA